MKNLLLTALLLVSLTTNATTYQVGSTHMYQTPNSLYLANVVQDGDTIEIDSETFTGTACLAKWQWDNLYIVGTGATKPHMKANGQYISGKGIWVLGGDNITVENIEFSEASVPDLNGAGIRLDGVGLHVNNCYFHDNENGILTSNNGGDITIEHSEFDHNVYGDGYSHNLYIGHINKLVFKYNYSHHAYIGHNLKSRANENYILYNRIMDEETGESSRLIDLPNGGFSIVMGNLLMQGNNAVNNNFIGYGLEGLTNTQGEFYFINNTLVNKRSASCLFVRISSAASVAAISNNIFAGTGTRTSGPTTSLNNNITDTDIANLFFANESNYDYHLLLNSPAVNAGSSISPVNGHSLTPNLEYAHSTNFVSRNTNAAIDAGAHEYGNSISVSEFPTEELNLYPNPFIDKITLKNAAVNQSEISILSINGQDVTHLTSVNLIGEDIVINTFNLVKGVYLLQTVNSTKVLYKQ